jgi:hypothetical protein
MDQRVSVVGISWFELDDYPRVKAVMTDAHKLHRTYSEWRLAAEQAERKMRRQGHFVVRVPLLADEFVSWCAARNLNVDAQARMQFANEGALQKYRAVQEGPKTAH